MEEDKKDELASSSLQPQKANPILEAYQSIKRKLDERKEQQLEKRKMRAQERLNKLRQEREVQKIEEEVMALEKEQGRKNPALKQKIDAILSPILNMRREAPQPRALLGGRKVYANRERYVVGHQMNRLIFQDGNNKSKSLLYGDNKSNAASLLYGGGNNKSKSLLYSGRPSNTASLLYGGGNKRRKLF